MSWKRLLPLQVRDVEILLEQSSDGEGFRLRRGEKVLDLTSSEADAAGRQPGKDLEAVLRASGYSIYEPERSDRFMHDIGELQRRVHRDARTAILLDSTTVAHAADVVAGSLLPTPVALLDLASVTFALVMYDRVLVLNHGDRLAPVRHAVEDLDLHPKHRILRDTLWELCQEAYTAGGRRPAMAKWHSAWGRLLDIDPADLHLDLNAYDRYTDSPGDWAGAIEGDAGNELTLAWLATGATPSVRDDYLSVVTMRAIFNDFLSARLRVPYLASSLRAPIHCELIAARARVLLAADDVLARVAPPPLGHGRGPYRVATAAPFPLALALTKMSHPEDYWAAITELRLRMQPLRDSLRRARDGDQNDPTAYLRQVKESLSATCSQVPKDVADVVATMAPLGFSDPASATVGLVVKLLGLTGSSRQMRDLFWRVFRPELHLLLDLRSQAKRLGDVSDQVRTIWGHDVDHKELQRLASIQPLTSSRLGDLS